MITITDVARQAGVTAATVSHVLTGNATVREATRQRVQAAIDQLGYRPNLLARALSHGTTRLLVLLVPAECDQAQMQAVTRVVATAEAANGHVLLSVYQDDLPQHVERFLPFQVGGLSLLEATMAYTLAPTLIPLGVSLAFCVPVAGHEDTYHPVLIQAAHPPQLPTAASGRSASVAITLCTSGHAHDATLDLTCLASQVQVFLAATLPQAGTLAEAASAATLLLLTPVRSGDIAARPQDTDDVVRPSRCPPETMDTAPTSRPIHGPI